MRKLLIFTSLLLVERAAEACGCFAPPDPTVPVVQAGELIAFAMKDGNVDAHIQIQYSGAGGDFGWLLPLPSEPTLELGSDELFAKLQQNTSPNFLLTRVYEGNCGAIQSSVDLGAFAPSDMGAAALSTPLVYQDSIGPYDYAVLKADSKNAMLTWLGDNHYFVPAGTSDAVDAYIHPGAFFLALKLKAGQSAGDLQPVVVHYKSDLPMIPIVLTSVGAQPNMGIYVWILGQMRAIPRNYHHTVINDALVNWEGGGNYKSVVTQAVSEAPQKHSFVTEFAGPSSVMHNAIDYPGRFGSLNALQNSPNADYFLAYLRANNYPYTSQLLAILGRYFPVPELLKQQGVTPGQFYFNIATYRLTQPQAFEGWTPNFVPVEIAAQIDERVIQPTKKAAAMFEDHPYLTRLFTTLSPEDMTEDPVFSFNPKLGDVSNVHKAVLTFHCGLGSYQYNTPATLVTESGWVVQYANGYGAGPTSANLPAAERTEILGEDGVTVVSEHKPEPLELAQGCGVVEAGGTSTGALFLFVAVTLLMVRRRRAS
jgi:MYXO-CTERM domain-containing protein